MKQANDVGDYDDCNDYEEADKDDKVSDCDDS